MNDLAGVVPGDGPLTRIAALISIERGRIDEALVIVVRRDSARATACFAAEAVIRGGAHRVEGGAVDSTVETGHGDTREAAIDDLEQKLRAMVQSEIERLQSKASPVPPPPGTRASVGGVSAGAVLAERQKMSRTAYTIGHRESYDAACAGKEPRKVGRYDADGKQTRNPDGSPYPGGSTFRTAEAAAAFIKHVGRPDFAVYELELPTGWDTDVADPAPGALDHSLLHDARIVCRVDV